MRDVPVLLIAGASGHLGRRAAEIVLETHAPQQLILVTRNPAALAAFSSRSVVVRYGDFARAESLPSAFADADRMLLISATDLDRRLAQHKAAIDAAVAAGVGHIVYTSGLAPAPPNPAAVAASHFATERYLAGADVAFTILRNSLYAEYQVTDAERAIATGRLVHNFGSGRIAHVSREDCAATAAAVLAGAGHAGAVYDITGPEALGAADLARLYGEIAARDIEPVALDDDAFVASLVGDASNEAHMQYGAQLVASFGRAIREGFMASCSKTVEQLTGRPARTLRATLERALVSRTRSS